MLITITHPDKQPVPSRIHLCPCQSQAVMFCKKEDNNKCNTYMFIVMTIGGYEMVHHFHNIYASAEHVRIMFTSQRNFLLLALAFWLILYIVCDWSPCMVSRLPRSSSMVFRTLNNISRESESLSILEASALKTLQRGGMAVVEFVCCEYAGCCRMMINHVMVSSTKG